MAIIGTSGRIGSGKDTVGRIIQYLTWCKKSGNTSSTSYQDWDKLVPTPCSVGQYQTWETKKFAGKLKQICSLLTGIPVEDFEKSSVKDSYLSEIWNKYGINAEIHHPDEYGYVSSYEEAVELANTVGEDPKFIQKYRMTVRYLLQQVGTNGLRNIVHPNIHVIALFADYNGLKDFKGGSLRTYDDTKHNYPDWLITDCRFPNEADYVTDMGGIIIRVNRPTEEDARTCLDCGAGFSLTLMDDNNGMSPCCRNHNHASVLRTPSTHPSETALDDYPFEHIIVNDGTIDELIDKVKAILVQTKILHV